MNNAMVLLSNNIPKKFWEPTATTVISNYRFAKAFRFLLVTWLHQLSMEERASVLLSIVKHFPLLDADHSSALIELNQTPGSLLRLIHYVYSF